MRRRIAALILAAAMILALPGCTSGTSPASGPTHLPCSDFSLEEIKKCDLIPFQAGIDQGTDMIMTAHIQYPQIEKETYVSVQDGKEINLPATLSHTIITSYI